MKIKQFRSILALAVVVASVTSSISPAQAFTWDELWNAVKRGYENAPSSNSSQQPGGSDESPQAAPEQNNYSEPSSPTPPQRRRVIRRAGRPVQVNCVKANGPDIRAIGRDDSESTVSVGRNAIKVYGKVDIYTGSPYGETCSIQVHPSSEKVALAFAIPDNSSLYNVRVSVYVDGQERISKIMSRGQARKYTIDVTGANSYAYTLEPLDRINGDIYFPHISQPS